jgi:2-polyprenyl-6-methoxyphenol hydroxylase-like FAD-dependent oxidoreductase
MVVAHFEDGSQAEGSNLVGCDGSRSRVREILVGTEKAKPIDTGIKILNFPSSYTAEQARALRAVHPIFKVAYHPDLNNVYLLSSKENRSSTGYVY